MKWFVLYTKPNYELKVAQGINTLGINAYCPTYMQIKHYSDRKKKVQKPLLPSYVLVQLSEQDRPKVFAIPGVVRYLFWLGKPAVVREEEITLLKKNLAGVFDEAMISKMSVGKEYTIPSGPLKGQTGSILDVLKNKLRLELPSLGLFVTLARATN
ncbi:UpxY family transcription antiterminator [Flavobacteriaceae bacterium]|nr:UpxY family transcription antiterminator [Flavobacteriaceae bacterium]